MFSSRYIFVLVVLCCAWVSQAQDCNLSIQGKVYDQGSGLALPYVTVFVQELSRGAVTDDVGDFRVGNICPGHYHLTFSHIGCEPKKIHIDLAQDTSITVMLLHSSTSLNTVVVEGAQVGREEQAQLVVGRKSLEDNTNKNLAAVLENEAGVNLLKNGGISKPVVHGLYGNRLPLLNNGLVQAGQQWGNDHSPEIDPFAADQIVVLKGASALEYSAGSLGSAILVSPKPIEKEPHLHGQVNYFFETNGRGQGLNTRLEKYTPQLAWRTTGTLKRYGDRKTADYFLNNTGLWEANLALQLEKSISDELHLEFYGSTFNTILGVLRGSHISNLTELEQALTRDEPFYTEPNFSYGIEAPRQRVGHHLIKVKAKYFLSQNESLELILANQINERNEFDIRRGNRSEIPALSLRQFATNVDLKYLVEFKNSCLLKLGNQNVITDNTNDPETGVLPLIPDYRSLKSGLYSTLSGNKKKTHFSLGLRYDYEFQNVLTISNTIPREIIRYENQFHNIAGLVALKYELSNRQALAFNTAYAMRNPAINERYSNGLHQGVSGIEEGDVLLGTEKAFKNTLEYKWFPSANFSLDILAYHQHFQDYIFLNPQEEIRLTIRGAFPVFKYEQTDANIYGLDLSTQFTLVNNVLGVLNYSYLRGRDITNDQPLVFMPSNSLYGSLSYRAGNTVSLTEKVLLEDSEIQLNTRWVFQQKNILLDRDFAPAPPGYKLLGLKISTNVLFKSYKFRFFMKGENLLNVSYRDYLNRQRYFADDLGLSVTTGVNFKF